MVALGATQAAAAQPEAKADAKAQKKAPFDHMAHANATTKLVAPSMGDVTTAATPDRLVCSTTGGYGYIRNAPNELALGSCMNGWEFLRQRCNDATCYYSFGYAAGNFQGCGWIASGNSYFTSDADHGNCIRGSIGWNEFARVVNCAPEACNDGWPTQLTRTCGMYANARPWTTTGGANHIRNRDAGYWVHWRYISRDNGYAMVRDPNVPDGQGNWVFVQRDCLKSEAELPGNKYYP